MENLENNVVNTESQVENPTTEVNQEKETFSKEEVLALLQSETDRRVTSALQKQQKKFDKQLSLSKLDGSEREKAEKDNRIQELEEYFSRFESY